jgi:hypothetical protein
LVSRTKIFFRLLPIMPPAVVEKMRSVAECNIKSGSPKSNDVQH